MFDFDDSGFMDSDACRFNRITADGVKMMKNEENQPIKSVTLGLFKISGIWAAIFSPVVIVIMAWAIPFGNVLTRSYLLSITKTIEVKVFLLLMITLPLWYGLHRILQLLHDVNIYPKREKLLTYGLAFAWTAHAIYILFIR